MCQKKIMRKRSRDSTWEDSPKKRISPSGNILPIKIPPGEVLTDISGKQWKIGKSVGSGGFGDIYLASDNLKAPVKNDVKHIAKVESHKNGPLFVEINCFLRIGRKEMITEWKSDHQMVTLGMPHYIASGSYNKDNEKLRFLIMPRYEDDLEKIFLAKQRKFNLKTVLVISSQILDVLEYIHSKGYVHCDIKASNILRSKAEHTVYIPNIVTYKKRQLRPNRTRNFFSLYNTEYAEMEKSVRLRPKRQINYVDSDNEESEEYEEIQITKCIKTVTDQVYLIDYGLASKYRLSNGQHKQYCNDERKAHAGTVLFCSLDAHLGAQSRRSDLESLGYNMIYWLASALPWEDDVENPETVQLKKQNCFQNLEMFLSSCFVEYPNFLLDYFTYVKTLSFESKPDYKYCKQMFRNALEEYGYKVDSHFDFNNTEGWGKKQKTKVTDHNSKHKRKYREPLTCNALPQKTVLKKKISRKKKLHWSKILSDPETILRQSNKELFMKNTDAGDSPTLQNLNIWELNPTYAMLEIYEKCRDKNYNNVVKNGKSDGDQHNNHEGYTPAMCDILKKMKQERRKETQGNNGAAASRRTKTSRLNQRSVNTMYNHNDVRRKISRRNGLRN